MTKNHHISIIIAVYQREDELKELLNSLSRQIVKADEIIIVDDGSPNKLDSVVNSYKNELPVQYFHKQNEGPAKARNFGMRQAKGDYFIFLDSDTIAPENYIAEVHRELNAKFVDAFGGPDAAEENFSTLQKSITFSMTSFLTTGGIRGGKKQIGKFQPRSFNMGISRKAFEKTGGFGDLRIGEDPDLSMTLWENGFTTRFFAEAKVYHKRRTSLSKFAKQVHQFGIARPILNQRHPKYTKPTFWLPSLFFIYSIICLIGFMVAFVNLILKNNTENYMLYASIIAFPMWVYLGLIFIFASLQFHSIKVGLLSVLTTIIQFWSYGYGFLKSWISINVFKMNPRKKFPTHFSN